MTQLVTFSVNGTRRPGALKNNRVFDLKDANLPEGEFGDLIAIVQQGSATLERIDTLLESDKVPNFSLEDIKLEAPIQHPPKVIGIGLNYIDHCKEANMPIPQEPVIFTKYSSSVTGPYDDVHWYHDTCQQMDYEVELGVIIGKKASRVTEKDALKYVLGYTVVNDVSARDLQLGGAGQWDIGKSLDTFCPYGPSIVTTDEISDPHNLNLKLSVNGEERQASNTSNLIFDIPALIAYLTKGITLLPGDLIATGTPFGVAMGMKSPKWLKDGDVCEATVESIGTIRNTMRML